MEEFSRELDLLLAKYPLLPEFTLNVRPRVSIQFAAISAPITVKTGPQPAAPSQPMIGETVLPPMNSLAMMNAIKSAETSKLL